MTAGQITDSAERLIALGYRRTSRKYGGIARIDRVDWVQVLADSMFSTPARYLDKKTGKPSGDWCDHFRRVHSNDKLDLLEGYDTSSRPIVMEKFLQIPPSGFDNCGYIDPETLQQIEPPKLPADVLAFLNEVADAKRFPYPLHAMDDIAVGARALGLWEKYGGSAITATPELPT